MNTHTHTHTHTHTDRTTTAILAAHACRGLIIMFLQTMIDENKNEEGREVTINVNIHILYSLGTTKPVY